MSSTSTRKRGATNTKEQEKSPLRKKCKKLQKDGRQIYADLLPQKIKAIDALPKMSDFVSASKEDFKLSVETISLLKQGVKNIPQNAMITCNERLSRMIASLKPVYMDALDTLR